MVKLALAQFQLMLLIHAFPSLSAHVLGGFLSIKTMLLNEKRWWGGVAYSLCDLVDVINFRCSAVSIQ